MSQSINKSELAWACRRGMLEMDVFVQPFFEQCFDKLDVSEQAVFKRMLAYDDPELFSWFMHHRPCPDPQIAEMIDVIRRFNKSSRTSLS